MQDKTYKILYKKRECTSQQNGKMGKNIPNGLKQKWPYLFNILHRNCLFLQRHHYINYTLYGENQLKKLEIVHELLTIVQPTVRYI